MALDVVVKAEEYCFLFIEWWPFCSTKSEWAAWASFIAVAVTLAFTYCSTKNELNRVKKKSRVSLTLFVNQLKLVKEILLKLNMNHYPNDRMNYLNQLDECRRKIEIQGSVAVDSIVHWGDFYFEKIADIQFKLQIACVNKRDNYGQDNDVDGLISAIDLILHKYEQDLYCLRGFEGSYLKTIYSENKWSRLVRLIKEKNYFK